MISTLAMIYYIVVVLVSSLYVTGYLFTMSAVSLAYWFIPQYEEESARLLLKMGKHHWTVLIIYIMVSVLDIWRY